MSTAKRTVLIAGMGTSPAVLTETVWALAHQENELMYANYGLSCSGLLRNRKVAQTLRPRFHSSCRFDILLPAMLRQSFTDFIFATNTDGSGKPASCVRALDMLGSTLTRHYPKPIVGGSCEAFKVGNMSVKSPKKASELTVNCADRYSIEATC